MTSSRVLVFWWGHLLIIPSWLTLSKAELKSICTIRASYPLSNALCSVWEKCITGTQTFPISKLGGWKHSTAFHKSFKTNRHQALKHLRQYWCYENWSVIGNRRGRWTFRNWGDMGLSPASWETAQTNKPPKHYTKTGAARTSAVTANKVFIMVCLLGFCSSSG